MRKLLSTKYSAGAFNTAMLLTRLAFGGIMMYHGYEKLIGFRMAFLFEKFGWDIYTATSQTGRELKAGYILLWSIIEECYKNNITTYDIGGLYDYNKRHFKMGITDEVVSYYGEYEKTNLFLLDKIISIILKIRGTQFLNK